MHFFSKLSNVDEKINFLDQKLFKHSQIIEELETELGKIKFLPIKSSKQSRRPFLLKNYVKQTKGIFSLVFVKTYEFDSVSLFSMLNYFSLEV